ncbi:MAG: hypothetical protein N3C62_02140 [Synergistetes bacterium]|nr:hypothetical protein [Synergistota bacterium]MCX8127533.1 hypothetical protein [Synergistota bacterium]MDW8191550.1 hypothetical protein [Synergistota bacterium]
MILWLLLLSSNAYSLDKGKVHDEILTYTKEILEASTFSEKAKKDFYGGVERGIKSLLNKVGDKSLEESLLIISLKDLVKSSLLWRLSEGEVKAFIDGFGDLLLFGFSVEGAAEVTKRLIVREIGASVLDRMLKLLDVAINKYGSDPSRIESRLREKLSMLLNKSKGELIREVLELLRGEVEEAKSKAKRK